MTFFGSLSGPTPFKHDLASDCCVVIAGGSSGDLI